jgi:hypothetical protein
MRMLGIISETKTRVQVVRCSDYPGLQVVAIFKINLKKQKVRAGVSQCGVEITGHKKGLFTSRKFLK